MSAAEMREAAARLAMSKLEAMGLRGTGHIVGEAILGLPVPDGEGMVDRVVEKPDILRAAVEEYLLRHPSEGPDERISRAAAVRGMMVRLGLYSEFEPALARAAFQSTESRSKDGLCSDCPPQGYPTNETRCDECPRAALRAINGGDP